MMEGDDGRLRGDEEQEGERGGKEGWRKNGGWSETNKSKTNAHEGAWQKHRREGGRRYKNGTHLIAHVDVGFHANQAHHALHVVFLCIDV